LDLIHAPKREVVLLPLGVGVINPFIALIVNPPRVLLVVQPVVDLLQGYGFIQAKKYGDAGKYL
jgi:hypothetical protein